MWTCRRSKRMRVLYVCALYLTHSTSPPASHETFRNTLPRYHALCALP